MAWRGREGDEGEEKGGEVGLNDRGLVGRWSRSLRRKGGGRKERRRKRRRSKAGVSLIA